MKQHGRTSHSSGFSFSQVHRYTVVIVDSFRVRVALSAPDLTSTQSESFAMLQRQRKEVLIGSD
jgi:hypothetical protein